MQKKHPAQSIESVFLGYMPFFFSNFILFIYHLHAHLYLLVCSSTHIWYLDLLTSCEVPQPQLLELDGGKVEAVGLHLRGHSAKVVTSAWPKSTVSQIFVQKMC